MVTDLWNLAWNAESLEFSMRNNDNLAHEQNHIPTQK